MSGHTVKPMRWWPVKSTLELRDRLNACQAPRLEERPDGLLRVVETAADGAPALQDAGTEEYPDVNDSRLCPPICPDDQESASAADD